MMWYVFLGVLPSRDLHHEQKQFEEEDEKTRRIREKEEQLRKQEVHGRIVESV